MKKDNDFGLELTEDMLNNLKEGWEHNKKCGMTDLSFNRYLSACVMLGHNVFHKVMGVAGVMQMESDRLKKERKAKKE